MPWGAGKEYSAADTTADAPADAYFPAGQYKFVKHPETLTKARRVAPSQENPPTPLDVEMRTRSSPVCEMLPAGTAAWSRILYRAPQA